ncbi:MAG: lipase family protein [Acidobacteriota bacterium]
MNIERLTAGTCSSPFPLYDGLADALLRAHQRESGEGDAVVAHVLATCAGYAYADVRTVAMMMARMGLEANACVQISQTVDAMMIFSTAHLVQSRCGRVVVLCFRGTEPGSPGNWLGDFDVGSESSTIAPVADEQAVRVHAGFHLNLRATWLGVLEHLELAVEGKSVAAPSTSLAHPLEALYVTGHSLGGAMAVLCALSIVGRKSLRAIGDRLRAVYTFGQPMAACAPLPPWTDAVGRTLFRYVIERDLIPALPPVAWGPFTHFGHEYRHRDGVWRPSGAHVVQLARPREIQRALLALVAPEKTRASLRYSFGDHRPDRYIAALRPKGMVTELG